MRAFSPASTVDKWRRFTLSSGFTLRIYTQRPLPHPSYIPRQMRGRFQTYPLIEAQQKPSVDVPHPASACSTRQID